MANPRVFLVPIDLGGLQILNACFQALATAPQNPQYGRYYLDSTDGLIKYWDGTAWQSFGAVFSVNGQTGAVVLTQDDIGDGTTYKRTHNDLTNELVSAISNALQKTGGTMSGAIAMGGNKVTGLGSGTADGDAVNYGQMLTAIRENAGIYRGTYATKAALDAVAWQTSDPSAPYYVSNNDFAIVTADETHSGETWRYTYVSGTGSGTGWQAQYKINETPFSQAQLDAINSGITAALVAQIGTSETAISQTRSMIAGVESSSTASRAYAVGEYFIFSNVLYRATSAIASGGTITPGTNCTAVDLASELNRQAVKVATGTIGTNATSASVSFTGTVINAYATQGGAQVIVDISIGVSAVTFTVAAAPSSAVTCTVVYV